jgi:23S rRNA (guanine745-N1)-methyltransferase
VSAHPFHLGLLRCTVRGCAEPLRPRERALACARGHAFDVARAGHVNLLQPQDRRSASPGDPPAAYLARERWFERGYGAPLLEHLAARLSAAPTSAVGGVESVEGAATADAGAWLDLGCGTGAWTRALAPARPACGLDLAAGAIERAARADPSRGWVVANADRGLPFGDATLGLVLSVHARLPEPELARVLRPGGRVLAALPGARDLIELRELVLGAPVELALAQRTRASFGAGWKLVDARTLETRRVLDRAALADALALSYRGQRDSESERFRELDALETTLAWDLLEYERC